MALSQSEIERNFALIEAAAVAGERCPLNSPLGPIDSTAVSMLCREGRIEVEISGHNFRQITLLAGAHKGARTASPPQPWAVYRIIGRGTRWPTREARMVPPAPPVSPVSAASPRRRLIPYAGRERRPA